MTKKVWNKVGEIPKKKIAKTRLPVIGKVSNRTSLMTKAEKAKRNPMILIKISSFKIGSFTFKSVYPAPTTYQCWE